MIYLTSLPQPSALKALTWMWLTGECSSVGRQERRRLMFEWVLPRPGTSPRLMVVWEAEQDMGESPPYQCLSQYFLVHGSAVALVWPRFSNVRFLQRGQWNLPVGGFARAALIDLGIPESEGSPGKQQTHLGVMEPLQRFCWILGIFWSSLPVLLMRNLSPEKGRDVIEVHTGTQRQSWFPAPYSRALSSFEAEDYGRP